MCWAGRSVSRFVVPGFESCGEAASVGCQIVHFHLLPADFQPQVSPCPELPHVVVGTLVSSWTWANDCVCGSDGLGGQTRISPPQAPAQARPASYHTSTHPFRPRLCWVRSTFPVASLPPHRLPSSCQEALWAGGHVGWGSPACCPCLLGHLLGLHAISLPSLFGLWQKLS